MRRIPIFWKVYLTVLLVLFLPATIMHLIDRNDAEKMSRWMNEPETRQIEMEQAAPEWLFPDSDEKESRLLFLMACVGALFSYFLVRHFVKPLQDLEKAANHVARGDFSVRVGKTVACRRDEIGVVAQAFNRMTEQTERWIRNEKRLLGDISHELRSPLQRLNIILALIEEEGAEFRNVRLEQAQQEIRSVDAMVEELLALTRAEAASAARREPVSLMPLLSSVAESEVLVWRSEGKKISISCGAEAIVYGNVALLRRAMRNILANALHYAPANSDVAVSLNREEEEAIICIRDHGKGVREGELEKIFRPFYRAENAQKQNNNGLGLGLPMVRRILYGAGGNITAANAPEGGLLMTIRLPISSEGEKE